MSYYLLNNKNPHGRHFYHSRNNRVKAIVVHCTAGLEDKDLIGPDHSAENTARYAATTSRKVSWHSGSDTDTFLDLLPAGYTAWHCQGYNSSTYGHEISKRDMVWRDDSLEWVGRTLAAAAAGLRIRAGVMGIPIRRATRAELDRAIANDGPPVGFIGHRELDPTRRSDPGTDFPWTTFLNLMSNSEEEDMTPEQWELLKYTSAQAKANAELSILLFGRLTVQVAALAKAIDANVDTETAQIDARLDEIIDMLEIDSVAPGGPIPILGPPSVVAFDVLAGIAGSNNASAWYLNAIAALWDAGVAHGVDPVVLAAQCALETGWGRFTRPDGTPSAVDASFNNTCGLKARDASGDAPDDHASFPDLRVGALAHAHHLGAYAGKEAPVTTPDPRYVWVGPGTDHFGSAATVDQLGDGRWSPDPDYGAKVAGLAHRLRGVG